MRFYALIVFCLVWTLCRCVHVFLDDCVWIDIPFEIENDFIFYPLAILYLIAKEASVPVIISCFIYIIWF